MALHQCNLPVLALHQLLIVIPLLQIANTYISRLYIKYVSL